LTEQGLTSH